MMMHENYMKLNFSDVNKNFLEHIYHRLIFPMAGFM